MAQKVSLAVSGAKPAMKKTAPRRLVPNRESEGLKLAFSALEEGKIVSTDGMSKDEYIAWARARARNGK